MTSWVIHKLSTGICVYLQHAYHIKYYKVYKGLLSYCNEHIQIKYIFIQHQIYSTKLHNEVQRNTRKRLYT